MKDNESLGPETWVHVYMGMVRTPVHLCSTPISSTPAARIAATPRAVTTRPTKELRQPAGTTTANAHIHTRAGMHSYHNSHSSPAAERIIHPSVQLHTSTNSSVSPTTLLRKRPTLLTDGIALAERVQRSNVHPRLHGPRIHKVRVRVIRSLQTLQPTPRAHTHTHIYV